MNNCDLKEVQELWLNRIIAEGVVLRDSQPSGYGFFFLSCGKTFFILISSSMVYMDTSKGWIPLGNSKKIYNLVRVASSRNTDTSWHCEYLVQALDSKSKTRKWWEFWK